MIEDWKDIAGFEGYYQVSNLGRVKSLDRTINKSNNIIEFNNNLNIKLNNNYYLR